MSLGAEEKEIAVGIVLQDPEMDPDRPRLVNHARNSSRFREQSPVDRGNRAWDRAIKEYLIDVNM